MGVTKSVMNDLISVIVPIYAVEEFLDQCIESIVSQTHKNLEIILVDDGSPDRCGQMCDAWAEKDRRIKVIHKENGGLSDARNAGLAEATGDYIAFVDSDDWIESNMYETMLCALTENDADFCACGIMDSYSDKEVVHPVRSCVGTSEVFLSMIYHDTVFPVAAWNKLYRSEMLTGFKFPKGKICEDAFTTYLLVDRADRIVQIKEPCYHYRIRPRSIMTSEFRPARMDEEEAWRCNYQYMKEHYPDIAPAAYDFYLQKVHVLIKTIQPGQIQQYAAFYRQLLKTLYENVGHVVLGSALPVKYRIQYVCDLVRLIAAEKKMCSNAKRIE